MKMRFEEDPGITMERLAKKFSEDASQATARLAVRFGKDLANKTQPWGLTAKAKETIEKSMERSARRVCYVIPPRRPELLRRLKQGGRGARVKLKYGSWNEVQPGQLKSDAAEINRHIDRMRGGKANPPANLPWSSMIVVSNAAFNRAMTARRKRVGIHKGGWLGAGVAAGRLQSGPDRAKIGKNVASWAQKHMRMGTARWDGDRRNVFLTNYAINIEGLLSLASQVQAFDDAQDTTLKWYQKAIKRREKEQR